MFRPGMVRHGSCGKKLTGFEGKPLDSDEREVVTGDIGTMWVKNDGTTPCYWSKHEKSKQSIRGEWFCTGGQFYRDEDGFYRHAGRADDMLKPGGDGKSDEVENELREFVRSKTAHDKCPRKFHMIKELPRTATGKIQRFKLRAMLSE